MQPIYEIAGVLVILLLIFRLSLWRPAGQFGLRGGLTALNIATGVLIGTLVSLMLRATDLFNGNVGRPGGSGILPTGSEALAHDPLAATLWTLLPFAGATLGGTVGYLVLGMLWRRLFRGEPRLRGSGFAASSSRSAPSRSSFWSVVSPVDEPGDRRMPPPKCHDGHLRCRSNQSMTRRNRSRRWLALESKLWFSPGKRASIVSTPRRRSARYIRSDSGTGQR